MKFYHNKYFLIPLALIAYILIMFVLSDTLSSITFSLFKYNFYTDILNMSNPLSFFAINQANYIAALNSFHELFIYTIVILILLILLLPFIKSDILGFIRYHNVFIKTIAYSVLVYFLVNFCVNIFINLISLLRGQGTPISNNQANLESVINFNFYGLMMIVPICLIGPLVEELIFRKCFFVLIPNKTLAFVLNCLCFGLLHTISYTYSPLDFILVTLPYCFAGVAFSYCYLKTNNVITSYILHAGLNLLSFCLIILSKIGG